ncbi:MAG TPA: D-alanyl-D-alanine carboxypeptidase family protein [Chloroflexia bacterium]|nr:D-alanyl-D-alanine carboxypeptidase family protein [Chloroflexia bacterium]
MLAPAARRLFSTILALSFALLACMPSVAAAAPLRQVIIPPVIDASAAVVVEYPSGRLLYAHNPHERIAPASLTKILTAILALEYGNLDDVVTVEPEDQVGESSMGLVAGERQRLGDLVYGVMLPSGNDAAMAVARYLGGKLGSPDPNAGDPVDRFAEMMNVRVEQLGLYNSHFRNPHGLDMRDHYSSAYDLASLTWYALHIPAFNEIVSSVAYDAPGHGLLNTNEMLTRYDGADGVKTGWTDDCGLCLVTTATRGGHRLISVVLNAPHWYSDSAALLDHGFAKLAAIPDDPKEERLAISMRDTVSWLLVNAASSPPVPVPVVMPMAEGGGAAPAVQQHPEGAQGGAVRSISQPERAAQAEPLRAVPTTSAPTSSSGLLLPLSLGAAVFVGLAAVGIRRLTSRKRLADYVDGPAERAWEIRPYAPTPRALGSLASSRREPNLLMLETDRSSLHVERAMSLAAAGREGSSMSEFLLALRAGAVLDIGELAERYQLSPVAFVSLARAQAATGDVENARRTLVHGTIVLPAERALRVALLRLPPE